MSCMLMSNARTVASRYLSQQAPVHVVYVSAVCKQRPGSSPIMVKKLGCPLILCRSSIYICTCNRTCSLNRPPRPLCLVAHTPGLVHDATSHAPPRFAETHPHRSKEITNTSRNTETISMSHCRGSLSSWSQGVAAAAPTAVRVLGSMCLT